MAILPRCTFAIISHPDAGKTTMTEKLLWFGGVVREAGMVKSKSGDYAKSDWMELEKQRGISITSSVMSFEYNHRALHLLDTPGHKDFSEDTYRTLTAVESVLMMIDSAKGVEERTIKLMEVCRMRDTPIVTFMNKYDREALDPFQLIDDVEKTLRIQCVPMNWPVGSGVDFRGVYDFAKKSILSFKNARDPFTPTFVDASDLDAPELKEFLGERILNEFKEQMQMAEALMPAFNEQDYLDGLQSPVFFGSALKNFGVKETLDMICQVAPTPRPREAVLAPYTSDADKVTVDPSDNEFTAFIFKIQANMDPKHRDRITFMRVCSGKFTRGDKIFHVRTGKEMRVATPLMFQARDREIVEDAYPGDIIGLHDTGKYQIGDTFSMGKKLIRYTGIPNFAPELFMRVMCKDPMKAKHLEKGLAQLSEEGATQLFIRRTANEKMLGAVGALQFEVVKFRLMDEYGIDATYESVAWQGVRWLKFEDESSKSEFVSNYNTFIMHDREDRVCFAVRTEWDLRLAEEKNPKVKFYKNSDYVD